MAEIKLSKRVENTVGKGEIARYEQFLLFPQYFQKTCFPGVSKGVTVWEWTKRMIRNVKGINPNLNDFHQSYCNFFDPQIMSIVTLYGC